MGVNVHIEILKVGNGKELQKHTYADGSHVYLVRDYPDHPVTFAIETDEGALEWFRQSYSPIGHCLYCENGVEHLAVYCNNTDRTDTGGVKP